MMQPLLAQDAVINDSNNAGRTLLFVAVRSRFNYVFMLLAREMRGPHAEVRSSLSHAAEMKTEALKEHGVVLSPFRRPRTDNRQGRHLLMPPSGGEAEQMWCTTRLDFHPPVPGSEPQSRGYTPAEFKRRMCSICNRHRAMQILIPCNHKMGCRGCIKQFAPCHEGFPRSLM
jgi:hypothetical protein